MFQRSPATHDLTEIAGKAFAVLTIAAACLVGSGGWRPAAAGFGEAVSRLFSEDGIPLGLEEWAMVWNAVFFGSISIGLFLAIVATFIADRRRAGSVTQEPKREDHHPIRRL